MERKNIFVLDNCFGFVQAVSAEQFAGYTVEVVLEIAQAVSYERQLEIFKGKEMWHEASIMRDQVEDLWRNVELSMMGRRHTGHHQHLVD